VSPTFPFSNSFLSLLTVFFFFYHPKCTPIPPLVLFFLSFVGHFVSPLVSLLSPLDHTSTLFPCSTFFFHTRSARGPLPFPVSPPRDFRRSSPRSGLAATFWIPFPRGHLPVICRQFRPHGGPSPLCPLYFFRENPLFFLLGFPGPPFWASHLT